MAGAPVMAAVRSCKNDPNWKDYVLFHEYFHGDYGAGLGASHQTGWTGSSQRLLKCSAGSTELSIWPAEKHVDPTNKNWVGLDELAPGNCGPLHTRGKNHHSNVLECCPFRIKDYRQASSACRSSLDLQRRSLLVQGEKCISDAHSCAHGVPEDDCDLGPTQSGSFKFQPPPSAL